MSLADRLEGVFGGHKSTVFTPPPPRETPRFLGTTEHAAAEAGTAAGIYAAIKTRRGGDAWAALITQLAIRPDCAESPFFEAWGAAALRSYAAKAAQLGGR